MNEDMTQMGLLMIVSSLVLFILLYVDELKMLLHILMCHENNWLPYGSALKTIHYACLSFFGHFI